MLSKIEEFILGGNLAHDLIQLEKGDDFWLIAVSPACDETCVKRYMFKRVHEVYEQELTDDDSIVEYPLPIIGIDSKVLPNGLWRFCLNAADMEWGFISEWPHKA